MRTSSDGRAAVHRGGLPGHPDRPGPDVAILEIASRRPTDFVDITGPVADAVRAAGLEDGAVLVHTRHTTTGLLVNEHEPLLLQDLERLFSRLAPEADVYAHDDFGRRAGPLSPDERRNGHAHCRAALLRQSESLPVSGGDLYLGRWQRLFLVDFDGPQTRQVALTFLWISPSQARPQGENPIDGAGVRESNPPV